MQTSNESCATRAVAITPSDETDLAAPQRALYIGTGGDVKVKTVAGDEVTFVGVPGGTILPVSVLRVFDTGTDADDIVGLRNEP